MTNNELVIAQQSLGQQALDQLSHVERAGLTMPGLHEMNEWLLAAAAGESRDWYEPIARMVTRIRRLEIDGIHATPTQWAYDQTCGAVHKYRERAEAAEKCVVEFKEAVSGLIAVLAKHGDGIDIAELMREFRARGLL